MGKLGRRAARQLADEGGAAAAVAAGLSPPADGPADPSGSPAKVRAKAGKPNYFAAANKARARRRSSLNVGAKPGSRRTQEVQVTRYEPYPTYDRKHLRYEGEEAARRGAIEWHYHAAGSPPPGDAWDGAKGLVAEIADRMGLEPHSGRQLVKRTLTDIQELLDTETAADRKFHEKETKMDATQKFIAADTVRQGLGVRQAVAEVNVWRGEKGETEKEKAAVSYEAVRRAIHSLEAKVGKRQTKRSGSEDATAVWNRCSLLETTQLEAQLDPTRKGECRRKGWTPLKIEQIMAWDQRHRRVELGCMTKWEWRFPEDPDHPGCFLPLDKGGEYPPTLPKTIPKYLSEARKSFGVGMKRKFNPADRTGKDMSPEAFQGSKAEDFDYTGLKMLGKKTFDERFEAELRRVDKYVGGVWKNVKRDWKTLRLPGRRYEKLYGSEPVEWYERTIPRWQYEVIEVLKHKANPVVCVTEMMEHQVQQGNRMYAGTEFADSWVMLQDGLAQWWEPQSMQFFHDVCKMGEDRYVHMMGETVKHLPKHYQVTIEVDGKKKTIGKRCGNRPEFMPLDSHLNADHEEGLRHHVALTSSYANDDSRKFKMGTPKEVADSMSRTWKIFPTDERVVQDMLKFPKAVTAIKNAKGGMVWKLGERTGRRKYLRLPHHADCDDAVAARAKKYRDFHAAEVRKMVVESSESESEDD